jgi:hypothetical protein
MADRLELDGDGSSSLASEGVVAMEERGELSTALLLPMARKELRDAVLEVGQWRSAWGPGKRRQRR